MRKILGIQTGQPGRCSDSEPGTQLGPHERHFAWHSYVFFNVNKTISDFSYNGLGTLRGTCKSYQNHYCHLSNITTHRYQLYPINTLHDDVIKWKNFQRYWPFVRGTHRSPVNCQHKGQWRGALMFSLICACMNDWVTNREAGDLRRHRIHYDVTVMELRKHCHGDQSQIGVIHLWYPLDAINIKSTWCIVRRDPASNIYRKNTLPN